MSYLAGVGFVRATCNACGCSELVNIIDGKWQTPEGWHDFTWRTSEVMTVCSQDCLDAFHAVQGLRNVS